MQVSLPDFMRGGYSEFSSDFSEPAVERAGMHRMIDPATGEHYYTTDTEEREQLVGECWWNDEGVGFYACK